jgi:NAD(P)H-flavin reductase/ferredoxin
LTAALIAKTRYFAPRAIRHQLRALKNDYCSTSRLPFELFFCLIRERIAMSSSDHDSPLRNPTSADKFEIFRRISAGKDQASIAWQSLHGMRPSYLMTRRHQISIDGQSFLAREGELLLDAALNNGIDLPFDCRSGHCGTCCVRLVSGEVRGGAGSEPGVVHACQCRISGHAVIEKSRPMALRTIEGVLSALRPLSSEVVEVGIKADRALPHHAGQYVQARFRGFPSRPYSITHPLHGNAGTHMVWFHVRRMADGRVTSALGKRIKLGHRVTLTGPFGSAHFRPDFGSRLVLVATNTGFAPIWSIAVAALRENPSRRMMVIAGGRTIESLYMGPALARLPQFPNVLVVPVCSSPHPPSNIVMPGRPTDYLPRLLPTDVLYACGASGMVESVKSIAANVGAACYADPFLPTTNDATEVGILSRGISSLAAPIGRRMRQLVSDDPRPVIAYSGVRDH